MVLLPTVIESAVNRQNEFYNPVTFIKHKNIIEQFDYSGNFRLTSDNFFLFPNKINRFLSGKYNILH